MEYAEMVEIELNMVFCAYDYETEIWIIGEEIDDGGLKTDWMGTPGNH